MLGREDSSLQMKLSGNSVVPPKTFPLNALKPELLPLRLKYCKKCDESWLQPFYRANGIQSSTLKLEKIMPDDSMEKTGINANGKRIAGVWWKNFQMYLVLRLFPDLMTKWKKMFPTYDDSSFKNKTIDELCEMLDANS